MPSVLTHHLFGQEVLRRFGRNFPENADTAAAFITGCQGPDPFFFAAVFPHPKRYVRLGQLLHTKNVTAAFERLQKAFLSAEGKEKEILAAYLSGFVCHYALDRSVHPYVYARQYENEKQNGFDSDKSFFHMRLETVIDTLLTGQTENPVGLIPKSKTSYKVIGAFYASLAKELYGLDLPGKCFLKAVGGMRFLERLLRSKGKKRKLLSRIERLFHPFSVYDAMSHSPDDKGVSDPLNRERTPWPDLADNSARTETFEELFEKALPDADEMIQSLTGGVPASKVTRRISFNGKAEEVFFPAEPNR